jgi:aminopeptidase-like protein
MPQHPDTERAGAAAIGEEIHALMGRLYPIVRSITGDGVRRSLEIMQEYVPLEVFEVPSGTRVFDWTVPKEWNVREAWVKNARGERVIDLQRHPLHVVGYSSPVRAKMSLEDLKARLHTLPDHPDWIPFRASYYKETWGFCLAHRDLEKLEPGEYEVCIDSTLADGSLTYAECRLPGDVEDEILLYSHICHPALGNDNLSGMALLTLLAKSLAASPRRLSYRIVFAPATIGSITWLSRNERDLARIQHGLVIALVGDGGPFTYKKSLAGDALVDRAAAHALKHCGLPYQVEDFSPYGYDERQFCSPGINLPLGRFTRTPNARYPEYHTSADDLDLVRPRHLAESFSACLSLLNVLEHEARYLNLEPKCEPQLGRRGLYNKTSADRDIGNRDLALLWLLSLSDGKRSLLDIAERSGFSFETTLVAARDLERAGLLRRLDEPGKESTE